MNENDILSTDAKNFLNKLHENFNSRIQKILEERQEFYFKVRNEGILDVPPMEAAPPSGWKCDPIPEEILDRRVEITGPPEGKMIINALNSGANVYMSDFEDSNSPTWENCIQGQINLYEAVRKTLKHTDQKTKKNYYLEDETATLFVRPRGFHLGEKNYLIEKDRICASLFDFGLYFFHNYNTLIENGTRPYFYLPKLESWREAGLWADIFTFAEEYVGIDEGTIRATVLIETVPAALQMDEILYQLRHYSAGLNCGRWDYIFSFIKCFGHDPDFILPDRSSVNMGSHFMKSYSQRLIQTCHRRGVHAMGGMAAQIPIKDDVERNAVAMEKVRADKLREVLDGHDGTWVAHPGLIPIAKEVFDLHMPDANQIDKKVLFSRPHTIQDLVLPPIGSCTDTVLRENIRILFIYVLNWLKGNGCVAFEHLMEDAATAEISRAQIWQWKKHSVILSDRKILVNDAYLNQVFREELSQYENVEGYEEVYKTILDMCLQEKLDDFLTLGCYEYLK
tara:strand:+ start:2978 stop:4504 length:1527 start_codon:yes stop_codon:yes gene_type:complete